MSSRLRRILIAIILLLLALIALLFARCSPSSARVPVVAVAENVARSGSDDPSVAAASAPEVLSAATVQVPESVAAGGVFRATWTGPDNPGDYLTIVRPAAAAATYENYGETRRGTTLELRAPIEAGEWEVRYVTARSRTVLGKSALTVSPVGAIIEAADQVTLGAPVSIRWSGPANPGDFLCIVPREAPASDVGNYTEAAKGSPLNITAPAIPGDVEIRYVSGQGRKVIGRRLLTVVVPETSLVAATSVIAGARFMVTWRGPANPGDYITVVPRETPDGQYRNYADTSKGSPLELSAPIEVGEAEIRYMTGQQARVLSRRAIAVLPAPVTLQAATSVVAGAPLVITWTGPDNAGDYLTVVPKSTPDGRYGNYANTTKGSPLTLAAPIQPGEAEIRYMSGQGARVLARRAVTVGPAEISLRAPAQAGPGSTITVEWKGPDNAGDYFTVVPKASKPGTALQMVYTARGSPARIKVPAEAGPCEVRYMSGQGNLVLARTEVAVQ